jgi:DNA-binding transcriptional MerR regulator
MTTAARILDVTTRTLLDWVKAGLLPQPVRPKGANKRGYFVYKDFVAHLDRMTAN